MALWLYQLSGNHWPIERYRLDIWEGTNWHFSGGDSPRGGKPEPGDQVVFCYAPTVSEEPGFCGCAVVLRWEEAPDKYLYFRPTAPNDQLKMFPWWPGQRGTELLEQIRGGYPRGTLWLIDDVKVRQEIQQGIFRWVAGHSS